MQCNDLYWGENWREKCILIVLIQTKVLELGVPMCWHNLYHVGGTRWRRFQLHPVCTVGRFLVEVLFPQFYVLPSNSGLQFPIFQVEKLLYIPGDPSSFFPLVFWIAPCSMLGTFYNKLCKFLICEALGSYPYSFLAGLLISRKIHMQLECRIF